MLKRVLIAAIVAAMALSTAQAQPENAHMHGQKKMHIKKQRGMKQVFLIQRGLPHYSMILMKMWDDPKLALTPAQKAKLKEIRKNTMKEIRDIAPEVRQLRKKIITASKNGSSPQTLFADVDKLASLKARATKVHLKCIYETLEVLTPKQIAYIKNTMKHRRKKRSQK
ncbi:Spy/CpxP family protein refolding chaperone [Hydrogenimonas sp.]